MSLGKLKFCKRDGFHRSPHAPLRLKSISSDGKSMIPWCQLSARRAEVPRLRIAARTSGGSRAQRSQGEKLMRRRRPARGYVVLSLARSLRESNGGMLRAASQITSVPCGAAQAAIPPLRPNPRRTRAPRAPATSAERQRGVRRVARTTRGVVPANSRESSRLAAGNLPHDAHLSCNGATIAKRANAVPTVGASATH